MPHGIVLVDEHAESGFYERAIGDHYSYCLCESLDEAEQQRDEMDVVVFDRNAAGLDVRTTVAAIRRWEPMPMIVVTTSADPTADMLSLSYDDYLKKPVDVVQLRKSIERSIRMEGCDSEVRKAVALTRRASVLKTGLPAEKLERERNYRNVCNRLRELTEPEILREIERIDPGILTSQLQLLGGTDVPDARVKRPDGGTPNTDSLDEISQWKFREAVESAGHAIIFTDGDGTIEYVNPAYEEMTGYTADDAIGEKAGLVASGVHDDEFYDDLWETISSGEVWEGEIINERADGQRYVIDQTIAPLPRHGGTHGFVAINTDITEKRRREQKIESLHEATQKLFQADDPSVVAAEVGNAIDSILDFPINVVRVLRDGTLQPIYVNDKAEEVLDERPTYEIGDGFAGEAFEEGTTSVYDDVRECDDGNDLDPVRSWLYVPIDGHGLISVGQTDPDAFDDHDRNLVQILASYAEIALERLEYERELERENERLERFASTVSHDLRNPLQVAEGTLSQLQQFTDQLERMRDSHERMEEVIEGVLTLTRQGDRVEDPEAMSVPEVATDCWRHVRSGGATLEVVPETLVVEADETRLKHLFENLFRNAVVHGDASTIRLGSLESGFYVEDDGVGIPPEKREAIFDTGYSTDDDGTGLGLAIVEEITQAHDWDVSVTESPDGGTRFEFTNAIRSY